MIGVGGDVYSYVYESLRIARSAKKGNRCRGWWPTAAGHDGTGNSKTRNSELDNTNGTINVAFRNDVRRAALGDIHRCFPPEVIIVCRVSLVLDAPGRAMLYLTLPGVFNGDRETGRVKEKEKMDASGTVVAGK